MCNKIMKIWRCKLRSWKENTRQRLIPWSSTLQRANYPNLHCNHCIRRILMGRTMQLSPIHMMIRHGEQNLEQYIRSISNSTVILAVDQFDSRDCTYDQTQLFVWHQILLGSKASLMPHSFLSYTIFSYSISPFLWY